MRYKPRSDATAPVQAFQYECQFYSLQAENNRSQSEAVPRENAQSVVF